MGLAVCQGATMQTARRGTTRFLGAVFLFMASVRDKGAIEEKGPR